MRTIFGNIISEKNLEPKLNTEYIYNFDMIWNKEKQLESIPVNSGFIVENVEQMEAGNYSFNIKGQPEIYQCTYGWAFIENTEKNKELLKQIKQEEEIIKVQKRKVKKLQRNLDSLYNF